jgi:hypothetical protein
MVIVMCRAKRKVLLVLSSALAVAVLLGLAYAYQRSKFGQKANALFDPDRKAIHGVFLPWPVGRPTLAGGLDRETDRRVRSALRYEEGSISTNGMTLIIHASDGTFLVYAN